MEDLVRKIADVARAAAEVAVGPIPPEPPTTGVAFAFIDGHMMVLSWPNSHFPLPPTLSNWYVAHPTEKRLTIFRLRAGYNGKFWVYDEEVDEAAIAAQEAYSAEFRRVYLDEMEKVRAAVGVEAKP